MKDGYEIVVGLWFMEERGKVRGLGGGWDGGMGGGDRMKEGYEEEGGLIRNFVG